jgi:hypothetical protein
MMRRRNGPEAAHEETRVKYKVLPVAVVAACVLALAPGSALAMGTLDQQQANVSGYTITWIPGVVIAQTFTAGHTGRLDSIDVHAKDFVNTTVTVEIETAAGQPTGTVLDKQNVVLKSSGWTHITLKAAVNVVAGGHYAIVFTSFHDIGWNGACYNAYGGGQALVFDTGAWYSVQGWATAHGGASPGYCAQDYAFRTYVTKAAPVATPTPTTAPTVAPTPTPAPSVAATDTPAPSASATSEVLGATAVASASPGSASGSSGSGSGSSDSTLPMLAGGGILLALLVGLAGFLLGRRRNAAPGTPAPPSSPSA